jgi:hypothetical protein
VIREMFTCQDYEMITCQGSVQSGENNTSSVPTSQETPYVSATQNRLVGGHPKRSTHINSVGRMQFYYFETCATYSVCVLKKVDLFYAVTELIK